MSSAGVVLACFLAFVMFAPQHFSRWPWLLDLAKFVSIGGATALGLSGFDTQRKGSA